MATDEIKATHSAYLELREERLGLQEGYRFLDEKRLILASEMLRQLARYEQELARLRALSSAARERLDKAIARHGLEALSVYPVPAALCSPPRTQARSVLGVVVQEPEPVAAEPAPSTASAVDPSAEAEACREAFAAILPHAARLAILGGNLERLRREYLRTARRARALEDVLLPELDASLLTIATALEELEREEVVRVRRLRR